MDEVQKVLAAIEDGEFALVPDLMKEALAKGSDELLYNLAEELYGLGFLEEAKEVYVALLKRHPDFDELKTTLADLAVTAGDTDLALSYLSSIDATSTAYPESLLVSADIYESMGLYEVSQQKLQIGVHNFPEEPVFHFAMGELNLNIGQFETAEIAYQWLLDHDITEFSQVSIIGRMGEVYAGIGAFEDAVDYFEQVPTLLRTKEQTLQLAALYLQLKDHVKAKATLKTLLAQEPEYPAIYPLLAQIQSLDLENEAALSTVQKGLAIDSMNAGLLIQGADLAIKNGDNDLAESYFEFALEVDPDNLGARIQLSNLYLQEQKYEEIIDLLETDNLEEEVDPQYYWNLGKAYQELEQPEKAMENYFLGYPMLLQNSDFLYDLITILQESGTREQLKLAVSRYLTLQPDDLAMVDLLAELNEEA